MWSARYPVSVDSNVPMDPEHCGNAMSASMPDYAKELFAWGQDVRRLHEEPEELLYAIVNELHRLGLEPGLGSVVIRTPHPQLDMMVMRWRPLDTDEVPTTGTTSIRRQHTIKRRDGVLDLYPLAHGHTDEAMWRTSPFYRALKSRESLRVHLSPPPSPSPFPIVDDLVQRGMTDYVVFPLESGPNVSVVVSIATLRSGGFPDAFLSAFEALIPTLSLSVIQSRTLSVSPSALRVHRQKASRRVLNGQVRQGDVVTRQAAIGFADLRGFTAATARLDTRGLLDLLGAFFQQVGHAIHEFEGEILKFMGDGVCSSSLMTTSQRIPATERWGRTAARRGVEAHNLANPHQLIRFGCGLHFGDVLYGNIGAPSARFHCTWKCCQPHVSFGVVDGKLNEVCVLSARFAELTTEPTRVVGTFTLKGLADPQVVYSTSPAS